MDYGSGWRVMSLRWFGGSLGLRWEQGRFVSFLIIGGLYDGTLVVCVCV